MSADSEATLAVGEPFEWKQEYDELLEEIASTDTVDLSKWPLIREIIKYKIDKNIELFLSGEVKRDYNRSTVRAEPYQGSARFPPFPQRERNEANPNEAPKSTLTQQEAAEFKEVILGELEEFDKSPPFTIQRLCELCIQPTEHYKFLGKYLRAVERTLLVTSTWEAFPASLEKSTAQPGVSTVPIPNAASVPTTPIFSPIPFLHEDARRSKSRSPPPSPLVLPAVQSEGTATMMPHAGAEAAPQAIGLVDELDDPSPGHLSEHPRPLSSTTDVPVPSKPIFGSLEERFTKGESHAEAGTATPEEKKQKTE